MAGTKANVVNDMIDNTDNVVHNAVCATENAVNDVGNLIVNFISIYGCYITIRVFNNNGE